MTTDVLSNKNLNNEKKQVITQITLKQIWEFLFLFKIIQKKLIKK